MRRWLRILILPASAIGLGVACYEESFVSPNQVQGQTRVFLTDAPFPHGLVQAVEVYVVEISASTEAGIPVDPGSWTSLAVPKQRFDLLRLQQGTLALVGEPRLPTDMYPTVRITIDCDSSAVILADGTEAKVRWPNPGRYTAYATVPAPIAVPDSGTTVVLDFDVGQSFAYGLVDPLHDFVFTASIRAVNAAATGSVSGTILGDIDGAGAVGPVRNASVTVFSGDRVAGPESWSTTATGHTDINGHYRIAFLPPDSYIIRIDPPGQVTFGALVFHDVTVVTGEDFVLSATLPAVSAAESPTWR